MKILNHTLFINLFLLYFFFKFLLQILIEKKNQQILIFFNKFQTIQEKIHL